ncbi:amidohydrolase family protein [bacterium]|nr:amidohydrolase family protein [bacterium]
MTEYFERVHEGLPITDMEIIDLHAHLGPYFNMHIPLCDADSMVHMMDMVGIDKTVISANPGISVDLVLGNTMTIDAIRSHRGRLYGACIVNGNYPELSIEELDRCFSVEKDMLLIKIHPVLAKCKMDDRRMRSIYEYASARKLFILVHVWLDNDPYGSQEQFVNMAREYPEVNWIMGHSGGPYGTPHGIDLAGNIPNIFFDLTLSMCPARQVEYLVKTVGADRVLFGTDNPFIDPRPQIGRLFLAEISNEDRMKIVGGNARKYFRFD